LQVGAEFARVANVLADTFYTELDFQLAKLEKFFIDKEGTNTSLRKKLDLFHVVCSVKFCLQ